MYSENIPDSIPDSICNPTTVSLNNKTSTVPRMSMVPGYISPAYLIDFRMITPVTWQSMEEVAFHFNLQ